MNAKTQAAYERIRAYFTRPGAELAIGEPDEFGNPRCFYRKPGNGSCAVGCLIPDELYDEGIEGASVYALVTNNGRRNNKGRPNYRPEIAELLDGVDVPFLCSAQNAHDGAGDVPNFLERLDEVALRYGLEVKGG